jgi:hypothetical protein
MNICVNYRHENITEESRIWPSPYRDGAFRWANRNGEGESVSFEEAVREAEDCLILGDIIDELMGEWFEVVRKVFVCEDADEGKTILEVCLWKGFSLCDLPGNVHNLEVVAEGDDEYGRVYSLAIRK